MAKAKRAKGKAISKKKTSKVWQIAKILMAGTLLVCLFVVITYGKKLIDYKNYAASLVEDESVFRESLTTVVYDANGVVIANLCGEKDSYYLEYDEIPFMVKEAFVVTEDRKFYEHSGVDLMAVGRAFIALIKNDGEITQGGSTITQQLARNIFLSHEVSMERKIKEMFIAVELENRYSKEEILEFYINNIYFGNGFYGIEAAARGYFDCGVTDLTISQMLFLCAIPNNPSKYDPLVNGVETIQRRDRIARQLYEQGKIDEELYNSIKNETISITMSENIKHDYVETFIRYCATKELMRMRGFVFKSEFANDEAKNAYKERYSEEYSYCNNLLFTGGYRIYTSIDMEKQEELQNIVNETTSPYETVNEDGVYEFQASSACIDNTTGFVVAIVGGREQEHAGYTLNRAFQSFRQPGSSIKPLIVYTPAFERGYTPETIVMDEKFEGGPHNADRYYEGEIDIRKAVYLSKNTVAWKLFEDMGISITMPYLLRMDFSHIVKQDYVPAASLGGLTYGASAYEMASAYATINNGGIYRNPTCIVKITDDFGNTVIDNTANDLYTRRIYEEGAADTMTDVLQEVLIRGTGKNYQTQNCICAAKTGTTNNNYDSWFVGYSYYYTTAVWCGYDMPRAMDDGYSVTCPGRIWHDYMTWLHTGLVPMEVGNLATEAVSAEEETQSSAADEMTSDETTSKIYETDEYGNTIEPITELFTDVTTAIYTDLTSEETETDTETATDTNINTDTENTEESTATETDKATEIEIETETEPETDEYGNIIEPQTGIYIPEELFRNSI